MTYLLSIDPGKNTGIALGYYDDTTPYELDERWQIHGGLEGFIPWWQDARRGLVDELVVEKFILDPSNEFTADLTPVHIEGAILGSLEEYRLLYGSSMMLTTWQPRTDKSLLTGYPKSAVTPAQKQRARFDFLKRFDLFEPGTDNDDSNDAITHALVYLKKQRHLPTLRKYWGPKS